MRDRFNGFVARHDIAWELGFALLALLYIAVGFLVDEGQVPAAFATLETGLTLLFAAEFGLRFTAARDRGAYLRAHWIDLLALVPPVRGARVLRLLRLFRLIRAFAGLYRAALHVESMTRHRGFAGIVVAWFAVMLLSAAGLYVAEHGVNAAVDSPFDAVWWGVVTMTTVGYGDVYPTTPEGRLAAMALMLLGIGLFSAVTATITSFLVARGSEAPDDPAPMHGAQSLVDDLERLFHLHRDGGLSEAEFAIGKARLLGAPSAPGPSATSLWTGSTVER